MVGTSSGAIQVQTQNLVHTEIHDVLTVNGIEQTYILLVTNSCFLVGHATFRAASLLMLIHVAEARCDTAAANQRTPANHRTAFYYVC